jgi:hypothetical protein
MKTIFFLLVWIFYCGVLSAQFSDSVHYYTGFSASGTYNRTNTSNNFLLNNTLKLGARKKNIRYNFLNKWLYGEQDQERTNNDFISTLDVNLYKTLPHFYYWGLFNYVSSFSLKINNQLQTGLGIAYNIIDRETMAFNLSDGIIYEYSDIILTDTSIEKYSTTRNSLRAQFKWNPGPYFSFNAHGFYQPSLQYGNDYIIRSDAAMSVKLKKWLSLSMAFNYNEISRTKKQNVFMTYGLTLERYF